ncbi:MAG: NADH-quinone oxidoreductase subunit NuoH [Alphaproteobacteria bacterium]|nr:NADH-quinone oxidoreductase subunit NuoH [Alphaproteobacteria bacterium]
MLLDLMDCCATLVSIAIKVILVMITLVLGVAYLTLAERKVIGAMQLRIGPNTVGPFGLLQPIADGLKLLHKEIIIPESSDKLLFLFAPVFTFSLSLSAWAVIPFDREFVLADINVGALYLLAISSLGVYGIIIAGWASNSKYALLGALRSAAQMISYEVCIGLVLVSVILCAGSLNLRDIVMAQRHIWFVFPLFPLFIVFFIASLAETNRTPFDLPEADAELVSGYNVEYSSFTYALFYLGEYANMILMSAMNSLLFFGGWLPPFDHPLTKMVPAPMWLVIKICGLLFVFLWIRATLPRYRYDQLMRLCWKIFLPIALIGVIVVSAFIVFGDY